MTVGNPESLNFKLTTGRNEVDSRVPCDFTNLTLKKLLAWIDVQQISNLLKAELKKSASCFPHQALPAWKKDFSKYLSKAHTRIRKKKLSGVIEKPEEPDIIEVQSSKKDFDVELQLPLEETFDEKPVVGSEDSEDSRDIYGKQ